MSTGQPDQHGCRADRMAVTPLSSRCAELVERAEHACFGISPFNGYFSTARIRELAAWGLARFERVDFFVPDTPSAFTLEALGYEPEKAAWKARRQGQYTRNKFREGEVYRCPEADCGCELTVTKAAPPTCTGRQSPTCCCGKTMVRKDG